jgi:hypothetical protein
VRWDTRGREEGEYTHATRRATPTKLRNLFSQLQLSSPRSSLYSPIHIHDTSVISCNNHPSASLFYLDHSMLVTIVVSVALPVKTNAPEVNYSAVRGNHATYVKSRGFYLGHTACVVALYGTT